MERPASHSTLSLHPGGRLERPAIQALAQDSARRSEVQNTIGGANNT